MSAAPTHDLAGTGTLVPLPTRLCVGLDLGKLDDFSALAVCEERPERVVEHVGQATVAPVWGDDPPYAIPHLQRWPLRTPYHQVAANVARVVARLVARPRAEVRLFADATGVGVAVLELLQAEPTLAALGLDAVSITAGEQVTTRWDGGHRHWGVPKKDLVGAAQVALQRRRLLVSDRLPEAAALVAELRAFEVRFTVAANAVYSHPSGQHDDLVLATALALWGSKQRPAYVSSSNYLTDPRPGGDVARYGHGVRPYGPRAGR